MSSGISDFRYDSHMGEQAELNSEQVHAERLPEPVPTIRNRNWPEIIIATGAVMTFCYFAEWELAVVLISILLAFILAPVVDLLQRLRVPRGLGSLIAVLLLVGIVYGIFYFSYNQAMSFVDDLPKYSNKIRSIMVGFRQKTEKLEKTLKTCSKPAKKTKMPSRCAGLRLGLTFLRKALARFLMPCCRCRLYLFWFTSCSPGSSTRARLRSCCSAWKTATRLTRRWV